jgi:hypothetical protein
MFWLAALLMRMGAWLHLEAMHLLKSQLIATRDRSHDTLTARERGILNILRIGVEGGEATAPAPAHMSA